jgi:hypothetical protein
MGDASPGNVLESVWDQVNPNSNVLESLNPNSISAQLTSIDLHFEAQGTSLQSRQIVILMKAPDGVVVLVLLLIDMMQRKLHLWLCTLDPWAAEDSSVRSPHESTSNSSTTKLFNPSHKSHLTKLFKLSTQVTSVQVDKVELNTVNVDELMIYMANDLSKLQLQ